MKERIYQLNELAARWFVQNLNGEPLDYCLRERQMNPQTVRRFELGYAPDEWQALYDYLRSMGFTEQEVEASKVCLRSKKTGNLFDFYKDRIIFPIRNLHGACIGFGGRTWRKGDDRPKYINTSETEAYHKGSTLYGLCYVPKPCRDLIICEGYMDCIALQSRGFVNAIAGLGTALTLKQALLIQSFTQNVYLLYDSDSAGMEATKKAIEKFSEIGLNPKIAIVLGAKDADEYFKKYPPQRFAQDILGKPLNVFDFNLRYNEVKYKDNPALQYQRNLNTVLGELLKQ